MSWGGLNPALAAWRIGLNELLPGRSTRSDGGRADSNHSSSSQHQPDADGTVDAFDEDRNYLASPDQDGNPDEDKIFAALNKDFMADPRAHLIIADRTIRNSEIGDWRIRDYTGASPHTEHTHRQVHQSMERDARPWKFTHTKALLRQLQGGDDLPTVEDLLNADEIVNDINPGTPGKPGHNPKMTVRWALQYASRAALALDETRAVRKDLAVLAAQVKALAGKDFVDESAIIAGVLGGLDADEIAAGIPADIAEQVAQKLAARLAA